jgi:hypothetical protein
MAQFTRIGINWSPWTYKVKSAGSSWGMYTGGGATPNLATETSASIATKWGQWDTDTRCTRNSMVCDAMKAATNLITIRRTGCIPTSIQAQKQSSALASANFKNPFKVAGSTFYLSCQLMHQQVAITVYDLSGHMLKQGIVKKAGIDLRKDFGIAAEGVYIVRVKAQ